MPSTPESAAAGAPQTEMLAVLAGLVFLVPLLVGPERLADPFMAPKLGLVLAGAGLLVAFYIGRWALGRPRRVVRGPLFLMVGLLAGLNGFFLIHTTDAFHTRTAVLLNVGCLAIFCATALQAEPRNVWRLLQVTAAAGGLVALTAVLQALGVGLPLPGTRPGGIVGTLGNSNYLGAYLLFPLLAAGAVITGTRGMTKYLHAAVFALILLALLLARARAAWIGGVTSLIFAGVMLKRIEGFRLRQLLRNRARQAAVVTLLAAALLAGLWAAAPRTMQRALAPDRWGDPATLHKRVKYFRASWWLIRQNPLFGTGPGSYHKKVYEAQAALGRQDPDFFEGYDKPKPRRVHNDYLEILNDGGVLAAAALALFVIILFRHGWKVATAEKIPRRTRIAAAGALAAVCGEMVTAVFFFPFRLPPTLLLYAVMLGILEGLYLHNRQRIRIAANTPTTTRAAAMALIWLTIGALVWYGGLKPLRAEMAFFEYRQALARGDLALAQDRLESALAQIPDSSRYHRYAAQFYANHRKQYAKAEAHLSQALAYFNGDVPPWNIYQARGDLALRRGDFSAARHAYQTALEYWPLYRPAAAKLRQVEAFLATHDRVVIQLR